MGIISCVISLLFLIISMIFYRKRKAISPVIVFFALWTFILILSNLHLYNIYKASDRAYFLIMSMLIFFALGTILNICFLKNRQQNTKSKTKEKKQKIELRYKVYYILCFCIIFLYVIDIVTIIQQLKEGIPLWQIRNWTLEPVGSDNPILNRRSFLESIIRNIILAPCEMIIPPVTAYYFFKEENKKRKYILLIVSILVLVTSSVAGGGGRIGFIYYIGCFILAFFIMYRKENQSKEKLKKYKKIVCIFLILGILFIVIYTILRTGFGNIIKQIYTYFALPPTLLSLWLPDIENVNHTFGMTTFFGIHSYFFRVLDTIGLSNLVPQIYNDTYLYITNAEIFKQVGYGVGNAFVTPIYYFYIDGGYTFVCLASLFFGFLISEVYERFEKNIDAKSFTIYALIVYGVFVSFMRIQTAIPAYIISFILVWILFKKVKNQVSVNE